jgi:hypothetical protein
VGVPRCDEDENRGNAGSISATQIDSPAHQDRAARAPRQRDDCVCARAVGIGSDGSRSHFSLHCHDLRRIIGQGPGISAIEFLSDVTNKGAVSDSKLKAAQGSQAALSTM